VRGTINGWPVSGYESNGDFSYGAGLDFKINDSVGLNADYMMLIDSSKSQIDSFSGGLKIYY
jgi:outer membrane autotransporter protein